MIQVRHVPHAPRALSLWVVAAALLVASSTSAAPASAPPSASRAASAPAAAPAPAVDAPSDAERLITSVEARYARAGSLSAMFTQTFRSAATGQQLVERGRIWVKRPGQMRWDYRQPEKKVFIVHADGTTLSTAFTISIASSKVLPSGFSQSTVFPACAAAMAISLCALPGTTMSTMSMSSRSSSLR